MQDDRPVDPALVFQLGTAFQLVLAEFTDRVDRAGYDDLRPIHGLAFQALGPDGATSTELARRLGVTKQAAGQIIDYLESRGYVERRPHPAGGRRKLVVLAPAGTEHMRVAGGILDRLEGEIGDRLGEAGLEELKAGLAQLVGALHEGPPPPLRPVW